MSLKKILIFMPAIFLLGQLALAADFDIYIYNKPFHARTLTKDKSLYVPLQDLNKALGARVETTEQGVAVNGKPFTQSFTDKNGTVYVQLKAFVAASGNKLLYNKATQMIDIVPGNSTLTTSVVQSLEDTTVFNESPPAGEVSPSSQSQGSSQQAAPGLNRPQPAPNLSAEIEALKEKYSKGLSNQADLIQYFGNLKDWSNQQEDARSRDDLRLSQIERISNQGQAMQEFANFFQSLGDQINQQEQSFSEIVPPPLFQNSHAVLRQLVENSMKLLPLIQNISHLMLAARTANPDELSTIMLKVNDVRTQMHAIGAEQYQLTVNYLRSFKADLDNLKPH